VNGKTFWERVLGLQLRPAERELLFMKRKEVERLRGNPKALHALKQARAQVCRTQIRVEGLPREVEECLKGLDSSELKSLSRVFTNMALRQIDSIIEEIEEVE
jgi:hypothetical protein